MTAFLYALQQQDNGVQAKCECVHVQVAYCELESLTEYFNLILQVSIKIKVRE